MLCSGEKTINRRARIPFKFTREREFVYIYQAVLAF